MMPVPPLLDVAQGPKGQASHARTLSMPGLASSAPPEGDLILSGLSTTGTGGSTGEIATPPEPARSPGGSAEPTTFAQALEECGDQTGPFAQALGECGDQTGPAVDEDREDHGFIASPLLQQRDVGPETARPRTPAAPTRSPGPDAQSPWKVELSLCGEQLGSG